MLCNADIPNSNILKSKHVSVFFATVFSCSDVPVYKRDSKRDFHLPKANSKRLKLPEIVTILTLMYQQTGRSINNATAVTIVSVSYIFLFQIENMTL